LGGENLDAVLEPVAEVLILMLVLVAAAAVSIFIINKVAGRRRDRAHQKISASRRTKHTQVDLLGGAKLPKEPSETPSNRPRPTRSGSEPTDIPEPQKDSPDQPDVSKRASH
jgi:4-hydroxybenzoate polyprenyltransferase